MIYRWLLFIMFSMCVNNIFSQKIERVHGEYTYYVPENISLDEGSVQHWNVPKFRLFQILSEQ